jgi:radical SAM protein with 4Fe4S-binding SPASM domain
MSGKIETEFENYLATIHDLASRSEVWSSRPSWLEFVPNNLCNLRCVMCPQADGMPVIAMRRDEAKKLMDAIGPHTSLWTPTALSEPLVNDIRFIVEQARAHEIWLTMYTNATLLTVERFNLIADRLYKLHISFDSHVPEVFESLRVRANYEETLANVKAVLPLLKQHKIPVSIVAVLMADNAATVPEFVDFLADLGLADVGGELRLQPMLYNTKACVGRNVTDAYSQAQIEGFLDAACARARARNLTFYSCLDDPYRRGVQGAMPPPRLLMPDLLQQLVARVQREYPGFCSMATHYLKVHPDGEVHPCCRAPAELKMGSIKEQPIEEIWNGPKYREFRRRMFAGDYPASCASCDVLIANPHFKALQAKRAQQPVAT